MNSNEETIYKNYGNLIKTNEKGEKYVDIDEIYALESLKPEEKGFLQMIFRLNGIAIRVKKITKEDRKGRVEDDDYGDVQANELEEYDEPVKAEFKFVDSNLVFENFEELDAYLENEFIPNKVRMKINRIGKNIGEKSVRYPSIQLGDIVKLKLSELENKHVIEYLNKQGIRVAGISQNYDSEFEQYDFIRTYGGDMEEYVSIKYKDNLTEEEMFQKFVEYKETGDLKLREELILRHYRLVPYIAWKISLNHNVNLGDVKGYGYEALIVAVDKYDPYMGASFATYAIPCISGYIKKCIPELKQDLTSRRNDLYYQFNNAKYIVEKDWGAKYEEVPEMIDDILDLFIEMNGYSPKSKEKYYRLFSTKKSLEEIDLETPEFATNYTVDDLVSFNMLQEELKKAFASLNKNEKMILSHRFGLDDGSCKTLEEVGKMFGLTRERVRQIEAKALRKLRYPTRSRKLKELYDMYYHSNGQNLSSKKR